MLWILDHPIKVRLSCSEMHHVSVCQGVSTVILIGKPEGKRSL